MLIAVQILLGNRLALSVIATRCHLPYRGEALAYRKASPLRQRLPYKGSWREAPERLYEGQPDRETQKSPLSEIAAPRGGLFFWCCPMDNLYVCYLYYMPFPAKVKRCAESLQNGRACQWLSLMGRPAFVQPAREPPHCRRGYPLSPPLRPTRAPPSSSLSPRRSYGRPRRASLCRP